MSSFRLFYENKLKVLSPKSLTLTKDVLRTRQNLEVQIVSLKKKNEFLLLKDQKLNETLREVKQYEKEINANKEFMIYYEEPKIEKKQTEPGKYVTNCMVCNQTCHYPCFLGPTMSKESCSAMKDQNCTECIGKCHFDKHTNNDFYFVTTLVRKKKRAEDMFKAHKFAITGQSRAQQLVENFTLEKELIVLECIETNQRVAKCVAELNKKALKGGVSDNEELYFQELIAQERQEMFEGFEKRIEQINEQIAKYRLLKSSAEGNSSYIPQKIKLEKLKIKEKNPGIFKRILSCF